MLIKSVTVSIPTICSLSESHRGADRISGSQKREEEAFAKKEIEKSVQKYDEKKMRKKRERYHSGALRKRPS